MLGDITAVAFCGWPLGLLSPAPLSYCVFPCPCAQGVLMLVWEGLGALPLQYISDRLPPAVLTLLQQKSSGRQDLCKSLGLSTA